MQQDGQNGRSKQKLNPCSFLPGILVRASPEQRGKQLFRLIFKAAERRKRIKDLDLRSLLWEGGESHTCVTWGRRAGADERMLGTEQNHSKSALVANLHLGILK